MMPPSSPDILGFAPYASKLFELRHLWTVLFAFPDHGAVCHDRGGSCCNQGHGKITGSQVSVRQPSPSIHTVILISSNGLSFCSRVVLPPEIVFKHDFFFLPRVAVVAAVILEPTEALPPAGFCSGWALGWTPIQFI